MKDLKDNLRKLRESQGMTQAELAQILGISASTLGMYETGQRHPKLEIEERIADYFNISLDRLRGKTVNNPKTDPLIEKIERLDDIDRIKTEGYVDNLLENDKYKTPVQADAQ